MSTLVECQPAVIPYFKEGDSFPPNTLNLIYRKIVRQDLAKDLFHDRPDTTEEEFVEFLEKETLTSIFMDLNGHVAGLAWIDRIEPTEKVKRGCASVVVFREYWKPRVSTEFGRIFLGQAFNILDFDLIYGVTPEPNRLSRNYIARLGFQHVATVPGFCSYHGERVNARISILTKEQFNSKE